MRFDARKCLSRYIVPVIINPFLKHDQKFVDENSYMKQKIRSVQVEKPKGRLLAEIAEVNRYKNG